MEAKDIAATWGICLEFLYSKEYVEGLADFLKQNKVKKVLDCACGTGFPALQLIRGHDFSVVLSDGNKEMAARAMEKILESGIEAQAHNIKWQGLGNHFKEEFDCVLCRGNSLVYVDSWGKNSIRPAKARAELEIALKNFYVALKEGGICYIDIIPEKEFESPTGTICEVFGKRKIEGSEYSLVWIVSHDKKNRIRSWSPQLLEWDNGIVADKQSLSMKSLLLRHEELEEMLYDTGFSKVDKYVKIRGENHYDIFIARKGD